MKMVGFVINFTIVYRYALQKAIALKEIVLILFPFSSPLPFFLIYYEYGLSGRVSYSKGHILIKNNR